MVRVDQGGSEWIRVNWEARTDSEMIRLGIE